MPFARAFPSALARVVPVGSALCLAAVVLVFFLLIRGRAPVAPAAAPTHAAVAAGARIFFTDHPARPPAGVFHRPETLYATVRFPSPLFGAHVLESRWIRPDGQAHEVTRTRLEAPRDGAARASVWVRFLAERDRLSGDGGAPAAPALNGFWTLELKLDERPISVARFELRGF